MYFLYGLSFYTMGVAIALQYRSYSSYRLAYSLSLLAAFGLLHGISEWGSVFIPVQVPYLGNFPAWKPIAIQRLLNSVSLFFLFCFGAKLIADSRNHNFWWFTLPAVAFLAWLIEFARFITYLGTGELMPWLLISESWSRYILAFPAGVLTAYGLYLQIPDVEKLNDRSVMRNLWIATVAFGLFALFSGLVVPQEIGWLSKIINTETFRNTTGLPIELFRTATALLATWSITRMLAIFDLEKQRQVSESRRWKAIYRERERFARDLHDDVIQSIYGVGLELQTTTLLMPTEPELAVKRVGFTIKHLNDVIHALRAYILGLETQQGERDFYTLIIDTIEQIQEKTELRIKLDYQMAVGIQLQPVVEAEEWKQELRQIIREALYNIVNHAQASEAQVNVRIEGNLLVVTVKDNGRGMPEGDYLLTEKSGKHMGLRNMQTRAKSLGGSIQFNSRPEEGTKIIVSIPVFREKLIRTGTSQ
jgi:signal transduction histidine kinase